jgi:hypothetical protein
VQPKIFGYRGYVVKVMAHKLPSSVLANIAPLKYAALIAIVRPGEGKLSDRIRWIHPKGIYSTPEEIMEFGGEFAVQAIDNELIAESTDGAAIDKSGEIKPAAWSSGDLAE